MAELLKGSPVAEAINEKLVNTVQELQTRNIYPTLAILRAGERPDDIAYERNAAKRCEKTGVKVKQITLPADCTERDLVDTLVNLNRDTSIHGVLLFRPLPRGINDTIVRNTLAPEKDIDGITDASMAGVFTGNGAGFAPCTAQACMEIIDYYGISCEGRRVAVVGRSLVVGKPAAMMLIAKNATVTICHTRTADMPARCREAEILIVSAGRPKVIDKSYLSAGQVIIDVGINALEDGSLCGDVDFEAAGEIAAAITPVPGGVGTVTTSVLVKHVVEAAGKYLAR